MKKIFLAAVLAFAGIALAQDAPERPRERGPGAPGSPERRPPMPLMRVLDANSDGVIDATEIAQATANLKKLDKNGDGKITGEELRPVMPEGRGPRREGPGGPEGERPIRPRPPAEK